MTKNEIPACRQCPVRQFKIIELAKANFAPSRFLGLCKKLNVLLTPHFDNSPLDESLVIVNKANLNEVQFYPPDNCPVVNDLRSQSKIPFATMSINFLNPNSPDYGKVSVFNR
jgi:hypothetical protein